MPINPSQPTSLLPEVRRADDIANLERSLRSVQIPHPGGTGCNVIIPENQISAKGTATLSFSAADNNQRIYAPTVETAYWDTGVLYGQYLLSGAFNQLYVLISLVDYYLLMFQLDSFSAAGTCYVAMIQNDTTIFHEHTAVITLGNDPTHKAGIMTMGVVLPPAVGTTYKISAWHTGGGTCKANVTVLQLF